jgi:hypothetical protein
MTSPLHGEGRRFEFGRAHGLFFQSEAIIAAEDEAEEDGELCNFKKKLCNFGAVNSDELPVRTMTDRYIDEDGNEHVEMLWAELLPEEGDEGVGWDEKNDPYMFKAEARFRKALKRQEEEEAKEEAKAAQAERNLSFTKEELDRYVIQRTKGLAQKSRDGLSRSAEALWASTHGRISNETINALRDSAIEKYKSADSHSKVLSFAKSFLKFLATTRSEPRYQTFAPYLETP